MTRTIFPAALITSGVFFASSKFLHKNANQNCQRCTFRFFAIVFIGGVEAGPWFAVPDSQSLLCSLLRLLRLNGLPVAQALQNDNVCLKNDNVCPNLNGSRLDWVINREPYQCFRAAREKSRVHTTETRVAFAFRPCVRLAYDFMSLSRLPDTTSPVAHILGGFTKWIPHIQWPQTTPSLFL